MPPPSRPTPEPGSRLGLFTNIDLLCGPCNLRKGAKDPLVWAAENGRLL